MLHQLVLYFPLLRPVCDKLFPSQAHEFAAFGIRDALLRVTIHNSKALWS